MNWYETEYDTEGVYCPGCGSLFLRKVNERWKRVCLDCYIASKEGQRSREQRREREEPPRRPSEPSGGTMDGEMLRRLLQLCHPDKHGGSESAIKATQWLLAQRKR